jgi:hypothetical protein
VRALRQANALSQQQLAAAVDVSRQTINWIEKERYTPSLPLAAADGRPGGSKLRGALPIPRETMNRGRI